MKIHSSTVQSQPASRITPDQRTSRLAAFQSFFIPGILRNRAHSFSFLRLLGLASLFVGVRSQLFPATLELSSLDGTNGFILNGDQANDYSGASVSGAGDVNGDGVADFVIGAPGKYDTGKAGKSYVVFGKTGLGSGGVINLSSLNGANGFVLNGEQTNDLCGKSVSGAGDVTCRDIYLIARKRRGRQLEHKPV